MPWAKVDDSFYLHPKVTASGNAAVGAWVRALSYCAAHHTDGFVSQAVADIIGTKKEHEKLCQTGMWKRVKRGHSEVVDNRRDSGRRELDNVTVSAPTDGYLILDFLHFHPTKAETEALRSKKRKAADAKNNRAPESADASAAAQHLRAHLRSLPDPTRPDPVVKGSNANGSPDLGDLEPEFQRLLDCIKNRDKDTDDVLRSLAIRAHVTEHEIAELRHKATRAATRDRAAYVNSELQRIGIERRGAA